MISAQLAAAVLAISGVGEPMLLDFGAEWCGPCRGMEPVVNQLMAQGYPVRKVDIDQDAALATQFKVDRVPTFVLTVDGREVDRVIGPTDLNGLRAMFQKARRVPPSLPGQMRGQSPEAELAGGMPNRIPRVSSDMGLPESMRQGSLLQGNAPGQQLLPPYPATSPATLPAMLPQGPASISPFIQATVRLKIIDPDGNSYGTGTIIDTRAGDALILTCGHVFRDSSGKGKILVDLFSAGGAREIPGEVVSYNLKTDVALVSIKISAPVSVAQVAPRGFTLNPGDPVISVGCNGGADPTVRESKVTSIDKYMGPPNVQVAGQPVQGRSGGGLFTADGAVVGVCNAADEKDNEGLYAALPSIHAELDRNGLTYVYHAVTAPEAGPTVSRPGSNLIPVKATGPAIGDLAAAPSTLLNRGATTPQPSALDNLRNAVKAPEVICIVRDSDGKSQVIELEKPSPSFLQQLAAERRN